MQNNAVVNHELALQEQIRGSGKIIICEKSYSIDWKVVNWQDDNRFSAYKPGCYAGKNGGPAPGTPFPYDPAKGLEQIIHRYRSRSYLTNVRDFSTLQKVICQFAIHHDGCGSSKTTFHVLHDERGLSVHFLIDNDGTIYQTLDLAHCAYHAERINGISIGVELCNRGRVSLDGPKYYANRGQSRNIRTITINNEKLEVWDYTQEQYQAMIALGKALARLFPNLPQVYPQNMGLLINSTIEDVEKFSGYLGHFHVTPTKWDPGCFDFDKVMTQIRSKAVWFTHIAQRQESSAPVIAQERDARERQKAILIELNELGAIGGYYPVGPYRRTFLWHGGIHLGLWPRSPIYSPFSGRLVAARQGPPVATGSRNFVLLQYSLHLEDHPANFYILFYHLAPEGIGAPPRWYWQVDQDLLSGDEVMLLNVPIGAGELIGHAGQAGPPDGTSRQWQVHIEVMSRRDLTASFGSGARFASRDVAKAGPLCEIPEIISLIQQPPKQRDCRLGEHEIRDFFRDRPENIRKIMRQFVLRFHSEWGADPNYRQSLELSPDFRQISRPEKDKLFREQIEPSLWWDRRVSKHTGLPPDFKVWHYHPLEFVEWIAELLWADQERSAKAAAEVGSGQPLEDDQESRVGFVHDEDLYALQAKPELTLSDLSAGYAE